MKTLWVLIGLIIVAVLIWGFSTSWGKKGIYSTSSPTPTTSSTESIQSSPISGQANVSIVDFSFNPSLITITKGTKVTWTNNGSVAHTVTFDDGKFTSSGQIQPGQTYEMTFSQAGNFAYHCSNHPTMKATIVVQ